MDRDTILFNMDKVILWFWIVLLVGGAGMLFWNTRLNIQLENLRTESEVIENELNRVKGVSEFRKAELDRIKVELDRRIEEADNRIKELTDTATVRKSLIDQLRAENTRLNDELLATIDLPVEEPLTPDELLREAKQLYFPRTFEQSETALFPADLVQTMLREIEQRRELDFNNSRLIVEQDKQINDLEQIISEHEIKFSGLQTKYDAQSGLVTSLQNEITQYDQIVKNKDKQIGLLEKKTNLGIKHYLINIGVAAIAFEIGKGFE